MLRKTKIRFLLVATILLAAACAALADHIACLNVQLDIERAVKDRAERSLEEAKLLIKAQQQWLDLARIERWVVVYQ